MTPEGYPAELMHAAMSYRDANLRTLLKDASLRPPMRGTPDFCTGIIDKFAPSTRLTVKSWARCTRCRVYRMRDRVQPEHEYECSNQKCLNPIPKGVHKLR